MNHLVLTVIAPDQPGLVEKLAQCIAGHGGNWLESRMARMDGQFAGILRVGVPAEAYDELVEALHALSAQNIRVLLAESGIQASCSWKPILLDLVGNDRPGIVRDITRLLADLGQSGKPGDFGGAGADEQRAAVPCRGRAGSAAEPEPGGVAGQAGSPGR